MFFDSINDFRINWKYKTDGKKAVCMKYEIKITLPVYKIVYSFLFAIIIVLDKTQFSQLQKLL